MLPVLQIGPLSLQTSGLVLILGLWAGLSLAEKRAPRYGINPDELYKLASLALVTGLVGARLAFVAAHPAAFAASPSSLLSLNPGLFDPVGGAGIGGLAALVYAYRKGLASWSMLDALTPLLGVLALAMGLANLASGEAFGAATQLPWGIWLWGALRHPTQIYQSILAALILAVLLGPSSKNWSERPGVTFLVFVCLAAASRLFLEAFRGDSLLVAGGLRAAQLAAWLALALGLWALGKRVQLGQTLDEPGS